MRPQWAPNKADTEASRLMDFTRWLVANRGLSISARGDYHALQKWSVDHLEEFWGAVVEYFEVTFASEPAAVIHGETMHRAEWFPGATLNYADRLNYGEDAAAAVIVETEAGRVTSHTYRELRSDVGALARYLRGAGVEKGDRVVGYLPNCYEGVVSLFAAASLGAVWSQAGMDYSAVAAANRLGQLEAKVLIVGTGYAFRGKVFDRNAECAQLRSRLASVEHTIVVPTLGTNYEVLDAVEWGDALAAGGAGDFVPVPVAFDHPLWVLFTSGTTGKPKGIVHGHGGVVVEQLKSLGLHFDLGPGEVFFWYTTPNWVMWNIQVSGLLLGATIVLYVGDPLYPDTARLWEIVDRHRVRLFGTSPAHLLATGGGGLELPRCGALRQIASTGSPLPSAANEWVRSQFGPRMPVFSTSGGTDIVGAFVCGNPITPVWDGEISAPALGVALEAWSEGGESITDTEGEMIITRPMPSMPVQLWGDDTGSRYLETYYSAFPGVWRQGDWITVTSRGTVIIHGRSDATLNRRGIRIGSAEIYEAVDVLPDVRDSIVVGIDLPDGGYWMPLFVVPSEQWDAARSPGSIVRAIGAHASKHYVPDDVIVAPAVPRTRTGKRMEVPVKRLLLGADLEALGALEVTDQPDALRWFARFREDGG